MTTSFPERGRAPTPALDRRTLLQGAAVAAAAGALGLVSAGGAATEPDSPFRYSNGKLTDSQLAPLSWTPPHRLWPSAAAALTLLNAAYLAHFGVTIAVSDSYRSLAGQEACTAKKGNLCAVPGTSNHGWGIAVDLGGGIQQFGSPQHLWTIANGPTHGWHLPAWARATGSKPEAWHFEYDIAGAPGDPEPETPPIDPLEDTVKPFFIRRNDGAIVIVGPEGVRALTFEQWQVWQNLGYTTAPGMGAMDPGPFDAVIASLGGIR